MTIINRFRAAEAAPLQNRSVGGTAEEAAEGVAFERRLLPQRLKPQSEQWSYRSAEALRHPKSNVFFRAAADEVDDFQAVAVF